MSEPSHSISISEPLVQMVPGGGVGETRFSVVIDGTHGTIDVPPLIASMYSVDRLRAVIEEFLTQTLEQVGFPPDFLLRLDSRALEAMEIFLARRAKASG